MRTSNKQKSFAYRGAKVWSDFDSEKEVGILYSLFQVETKKLHGPLIQMGHGPLIQVGHGPLIQMGHGPLIQVGHGPLIQMGHGPLIQMGKFTECAEDLSYIQLSCAAAEI